MRSPLQFINGKELLRAVTSNLLCNDRAQDAELFQTRVKRGDLLLLGTDGVFDNLFVHEILSVVDGVRAKSSERVLFSSRTAKRIAEQIARDSQRMSLRNVGETPFAKSYNERTKKEGPSTWFGGKQDDVTIVAAWIC